MRKPNLIKTKRTIFWEIEISSSVYTLI